MYFAMFHHLNSSQALAAQKGRTELVLALLKKGAAVDLANHNGSTALIQGWRHSFWSIFIVLIFFNFPACHFGHTQVVDVLLKNNSRVDQRNNKGTTSLMRAAQEGHLEGTLIGFVWAKQK